MNHRTLLEGLPAIFYIAEPGAHGRWTYVSPQIEAILGYTSDEWLSDPALWISSIHPDDSKHVLAAENSVLELGANHSLEYRMRTRDGRFVWIRDNATVVRDQVGRPRRLQGFLLDVTERKRAETLEVQTEEHRVALVETALDCIIVADMTGTILEFNPAAERTFGFSRRDVIGRNLVDTIVPPRLRDAHRAGFSRYVETRESTILRQRVEVEGLRADGSTFPVELSITPHRTAGGEELFVAYLRDISERQEAQAQLEARARCQAAIAALGHRALSTTDVDSLLQEGVEILAATLTVDVSHVFDVLPTGELRLRAGYGWDPDQIGQAKVGGGLESQAGFTLRSKEPVVVEDFNVERRFVPSPSLFGHTVASGVSVVITGHDGDPFGVLSAHTRRHRTFTREDIDFLQAVANTFSTAIQRKEAEEARLRLEDQLLQAQKMEAVGQLAGGVAHDFNNLLSVISGYTHLIATELEPDDPRRRDLEEVLAASDRAAHLVRQLLTFSRREPVRPEVLDVNEVIRDFSKMIQRTIPEDIVVTVQTAAEFPYVEIDRGHLEQIVMNLVVNSAQAMPHGGPLSMRTADQVVNPDAAQQHGISPGQYLSIVVRDNGSGIPPEVQARIFDPFFTTKQRGQGTGLGLSTVYGIVRGAGGVIKVDSELDTGTTFTVWLPVSQAPAAQIAGEEAKPETMIGSGRILVVDDQEAIVRLIERVLRRHGYEVVGTTSAREAIELARGDREFDLLITDLVMPELSGIRLSEEIRRSHDIKTLLISGYSEDVVGRDPSDGAALLQKPFDVQELVATVRALLVE